jgi:hypothetical protein
MCLRKPNGGLISKATHRRIIEGNKMEGTNFEDIYDKVYRGEKISFNEFLICLNSYGEVEFFNKHKKYYAERLNDGRLLKTIWEEIKNVNTAN